MGDKLPDKIPSAADLPALLPSLHQAPPLVARLALRLEKVLRRLGAVRGERLLLAVSGGADSTAMACLASLAAPQSGHSFLIACCDHGLRDNSAAECQYVHALAHVIGFPARTLQLNLNPGMPGIEERARRARYEALFRLMDEEQCSWLVTAHHADDMREDIMLRLLRGTGWPALGGMTARDTERRLLRPLLDAEPDALRQVLQLLGVPHCEDQSNLDLQFARNRVRHQILPALRAMNPGIDRSLLSLAHQAATDRDFFNETIDSILKKATLQRTEQELCLFVPMNILAASHPAVRLRLYLAMTRCLVRLGAGGQARASVLHALEAAVAAQRWPRIFQCPALVFTLTRDGLELRASLTHAAQ